MTDTVQNWDKTVKHIMHNPELYSESQRYLAWCYYYEGKTGKPVRQSVVPVSSPRDTQKKKQL